MKQFAKWAELLAAVLVLAVAVQVLWHSRNVLSETWTRLHFVLLIGLAGWGWFAFVSLKSIARTSGLRATPEGVEEDFGGPKWVSNGSSCQF